MTHLLSLAAAVAGEPPPGMKYFGADAVLSPYVYVFYAAFFVSIVFTPVMRTVATYYGIIDNPDNLRKMHRQPVAYLGGVAVFMGWLTGLATTQFLGVHRPEPEFPAHVTVNFAIVAGACVIVVLGLWDDVFHIRPRAKLLGQATAALTLLASGVGDRSAFIFISPVQNRLATLFPTMRMIPESHWVVAACSAAFVLFVVIVCCNATNLLDGLDGLCGGVTGIIAFGFVFLAVNFAMVSGAINANEDAVRVVLGLALLGAVMGFIPFNFNPASIFMGDTGSMFLGYACAVMIILFAQAGGHLPKWFLASIVMFALPILDTSLAFVRRWVNGRPLFSADRHHFHHQLVARGFSVKKTVMLSYGLALGFALLGGAIVFVRTRYAVGIYIVVFAYIIVAAYKMGMVHERSGVTVRKPLRDGVAQAPAAPLDPSTVLEVQDAVAGARAGNGHY